MKPYLYRLWGHLEFGKRGLAVGLHLSHGAAVRLTAVAFRLRALGLCRFLAVHRPHIGRGLLQHGAGLGHERRGKGLTRVLSTSEGGVNPWGRVPVGLSVSRGLGAVALLAVVLLGGQGAPRVAVAAGGAQRALSGTWRVWLGVLWSSAVFTRFLFTHLSSVSLATAAATAPVVSLAAVPTLESWAFLGLGWRSTCWTNRSPLIGLAAATAADATLVPKQRWAWLLLGGRWAVWRFTAKLWKCVTNRFFHLVVIAQHALNTAGQFIFLAGLKGEAEVGGEEEEVGQRTERWLKKTERETEREETEN